MQKLKITYKLLIFIFGIFIQFDLSAQTNLLGPEGFEGGVVPATWSQSYESGTVNWVVRTGAENEGSITTAKTGTYNASFVYDSWDSYTTKLVTPVIDFTGNATNPTLTFWHGQEVWGSDQGVLNIWYKTSLGGGWTLITTYSSSVSSWTQRTIALPSVNSTYYIGFEGITNYDRGIVIDDVTVTGENSTTAPVLDATTAATSITNNTASSGGNITSDGGDAVTARGVCWKTSTGPTTADNTTADGTGTGSFASSLTGLSAETRYYVRAYATNSIGTSYGAEIDFYTLSTEPSGHSGTFTANASSTTQIDLSFDAASGISNCDGYIILQRQAAAAPTGTPTDANAYSVSDPIGDGTVAAIITNTASTSASITSLTQGLQYYFSIIPFNWDGATAVTYNYYTAATIPNATATTLSPPVITTTAISAILPTTATSGGDITDIGGSAVSVSGICWKTSTDPTTSDSKTTDGATSATSFASNLSGLTAETYYYVRAYATNSDGTGYGSNVEFWTLSTEPSGHSAAFTAAIASPTQINLGFSAASTYGADGYIILRKTGAVAPDETNVTDGTAPGSLSMPGGTTLVTTITDNSATSYNNTSLSESTQYYYAIIPFNYNGANDETYNYYTTATIPTATATTTSSPSSEGANIAGNFVNNGTLIHTNDVNYITMSGTTKTITGTGIYTNVKMHINGSVTYDATISSGSLDEIYVTSTKSFTINNDKTITNVTLNNSGTLNLNAGSIINNSGNWSNSGTVSANATSSVVFNGSSTQTILSGGSAFENLTFNNTDATGIILSDEVTINTAATLTDGIIATTANNILSFGNSATVSGAANVCHVNGPVKKSTNTATKFTFPVGSGTKYRSIAVTPTSTGATTWIGNYASSAYIDVSVTGGVNHVSEIEYWDLDRASGSETATIELSWDASSGVDANYTELIVSHFNGTNWETAGGNGHSEGGGSGTFSSDAAWNSFSPFTIGSSTANNPLPVKWLGVSAECLQGSTLINWSTASETNNQYFTIEKSLGGVIFEEMKVIPGAGNSNNTLNYSYYDLLSSGNTYYRIKQTDFNGKEDYSSIFSSDCSDEYATDLIAYGNKESEQLNIIISSQTKDEFALSIVNSIGQLINQEKILLNEGINKFNYPINQANGIYFITLFNEKVVITKKIFW